MLPFNEVMAKLRGSKFTAAHYMIEAWTRLVYEEIKIKLVEAFLHVVDLEREQILLGNGFCYERVAVLKAFVQSLCDISFDESTVYFINHSKIMLAGAMADLDFCMKIASE